MSTKIAVAEATAEQLRAFASMTLGLQLTGRETKSAMIAKLSEVGYAVPFIHLPDAGVEPQFTDRGSRPFQSRMGKFNGEPCEERQIVIHTQDKPGGQEPVQVGVNGRTMLIPRGVPEFVPVPYIEALENAREYVYAEFTGEGLGGLGKPREVLSYPFAYA